MKQFSSLRGEAEAIQKAAKKNWIAASACRPPRNDDPQKIKMTNELKES
jgi:hypothetical protein